jgi:O-acetyl-ADP-ribose deacetylase (regulator of RNase III)
LIAPLHIRVATAKVSLLCGDITEQDTDAVVNAANSGLLGGGGVDGAIHRAGGPRILDECRKILSLRGECPVGDAVVTSGGNLRARFVIHTVGPVWHGGDRGEDELLERAYRNSLRAAGAHGVRTIAFPSISTGAYGFPFARASRIALETVSGFLIEGSPLEEVRFIAYSHADFEKFSLLFREERA